MHVDPILVTLLKMQPHYSKKITQYCNTANPYAPLIID